MNFIEAVHRQDASILNSEVQVGHDSTGWCNLANVTYQTGKTFTYDDAKQVEKGSQLWTSVLGDMDKLLKAHGLNLESTDIKLSPLLTIDPKTEQFTGSGAKSANQLLKREYRKGYEVPEFHAST